MAANFTDLLLAGGVKASVGAPLRQMPLCGADCVMFSLFKVGPNDVGYLWVGPRAVRPKCRRSIPSSSSRSARAGTFIRSSDAGSSGLPVRSFRAHFVSSSAHRAIAFGECTEMSALPGLLTPPRSLRSLAHYSSRFLISRSKPRSTGS